jgi:hypothetical protein
VVDDLVERKAMTVVTRTLCLATLVVACGSSEKLPPNYASTQAAISAADAVGARNEPRAALHLKMARDQLVAAQTLANDGKEEDATRMLDRARTDAEVALMVTRETTARADTNRAERAVDGLTREQR